MNEQIRNENNGAASSPLRLVERACQLGWPQSKIVVIDNDVGVSRSRPSMPHDAGTSDVPEAGERPQESGEASKVKHNQTEEE